MNDPCSICCHETRNAMAAVIHFAKRLRTQHPSLGSAMLDAAMTRLDQAQRRCAGHRKQTD